MKAISHLTISLKFVPKGPINNIPALADIMAWQDQATSHYLNQWWLDYRRLYASLGLNELTDNQYFASSKNRNNSNTENCLSDSGYAPSASLSSSVVPYLLHVKLVLFLASVEVHLRNPQLSLTVSQVLFQWPLVSLSDIQLVT